MNKSVRPWLTVAILVLSSALWPKVARGAENLKTESRMPYFHRIPLRDVDGEVISPPALFDEQGKLQEARANAFSTAQTCGKCHEYEAIGKGWHFNAARENVSPGRPGEPWILTDTKTRTQIPVSYRGWEGTFKPADLGISDYDFLTLFGRHYPGGGVGEPEQERMDPEDARMRRFQVTGAMEIDCLICHSKGHYDHEARYKALAAENLKWAPTIAAGLGAFGGTRSGKAFADMWRPPRPAPTNLPPIRYDRGKFDHENHVVFEVTRRPSDNNCYYCHTSDGQVGDSRWHSDRDVHTRAGMSCTDCHRNAIDHMIVRGYEGEAKDRSITEEMLEIRARTLQRDDANLSEAGARERAATQFQHELGRIETLSCSGCHYGSPNASQTTAQLGGRLGAPEADHKGMPPIHFEKLSCTACHSGPFPESQEQIVHTSLAHKLGLPAPSRAENTPPVIVQPVFVRGEDGKIAPHKMVWPGYWGRLNEGKVTPMLPEAVTQLAETKFPRQTAADMARDPYNTVPLADQQIQEVLETLSADASQGEAVFIAAGKMYRLEGGTLQSEEHEAAQPYAWALAHDVRPAGQSLGVRGCADCHAEDSPIYFGTITARGPVAPGNGVTREMWALRGDDKTAAQTFAFTFRFRSVLKYVTFGSATIVLGVLLSYGLWGLNVMTRRPRFRDEPIEK